MQKNMNVKEQMQGARASMSRAQDMMAQQTKASDLALNGTSASATVVEARDAQSMINMQPVMSVDLTVFMDGQPPYPATYSGVVPMAYIGRLQPGVRVEVKVDPNDHSQVWVNWAT